MILTFLDKKSFSQAYQVKCGNSIDQVIEPYRMHGENHIRSGNKSTLLLLKVRRTKLWHTVKK